MWRTPDLDKIISYPVGAGGELGAGRDEITTGLMIRAPSRFPAGGRMWRTPTSIKSSPIRYSRLLRSPLRLMRRALSRKAIARLKSLGTRFWGRRITNCIGRKQAADCSRRLGRYLHNSLSGRQSFREHFLLLSTGGLQRRRVFGSFARSFGHNRSGDAVDAPTAATQSDSAISITWSAVAGATHYKLYRATASGGTCSRGLGETSPRPVISTAVFPRTLLIIINWRPANNGCSGRSPEVSATTTPATPDWSRRRRRKATPRF